MRSPTLILSLACGLSACGPQYGSGRTAPGGTKQTAQFSPFELDVTRADDDEAGDTDAAPSTTTTLAATKPAPTLPAVVPVPKSMAALGDSITAGFIANLRRGDFLAPKQFWDIHAALFAIGVLENEAIAALEKSEYSWSAGTKSGHAYRLKQKNSKLKVYNAAITGAEAKDVDQQELPDLFKWSREELAQGAPDYVTLLIGANDICAEKVSEMTAVSDYRSRIDSIVRQLLAANPATRVLVNALPPIADLRDVAKDARAVAFGYSCSDLWHDTGLCPTLTSVSNSGDRKVIAQRVTDYNQALAAVVAKYRGVYGDRVRFAADTAKTKFSKDDISVDCFHPNPEGQKKLSEASWKSTWWK